MPRSEQQHLGSEIAQIKRAIKDLQSGRLQNASMHGTRLYIYDDEGDIREVIGNQGDGSYGSRVIKSPPQPTPSAPILTAGELGSVMAEWDGGIAEGTKPVVHGHLNVLAMFLGEDGQWDPGEARLVSSIRDRDGGATTLALGAPGRWGVAFQMVGADRVTLGAVSAPSEITVTALVDTEEIEAELEAARQERQEYRDAFDERTSEYDRLMAEQEDALAESDAWSHTALYRADQAAAESAAAKVEASEAASQAQDAQAKYDQVSSRQDASEAEIEAARQEAAAAHAAAGDAMDYAATTRESVEGLRPIQSTSAPSGQGQDGQVWERYNTLGRDRKLTGSWRWRDGVWNAVSLDVTYLPMADISQATIGDARAQRIFAEVGEVQRLLVGDATNLLPEESLWEFADQGLSSPSWRSISGGASGWTTATNRGQHPIRLRWQGSQYGGSTSRLAYGGRDGRGIPVKPGDQFSLSMIGWNATTGLQVSVRYGTENLSFVSRETVISITTDSPSGSWVVPSDTSIRRMEVEFVGGAGSASGNADFGDIDFRRVQAGELTVDGLLRSTEAVIRRLFTDETVARVVFAEVVRAGLLEADEGLIGSVLLKEGAVTADKLYVTEEMVAKFAQILHLVADQVEMNDFVAQSGMVGVLEAIGIILSNQAGGRRFEVSGDGFRLTDTQTDQVIAQLGTQSDDLISLHDSETGDPSITLTQDGGVGSQALTVASDPSFGGKRLAGDLYESPRWHSSSNVFGMTGGHVVAHHRRAFNWEDSGNVSNGQSIAHLEAHLDPGRLYRVQCHDFEMNDRRPYYLEAFYTVSDDPEVRPGGPNRFSLTMGASPARIPQSGEGHGSKLTFDRVVSFNTSRRIRINFVVGVNGGTGTLNFGGNQRHAAHFTITDVGPNLGSSGQDLWQGAGGSTASVPEPRSLLREIYPVARTATYTLSSSGVATRQYTNGEMRFGRWPDGNTYITVMEFAPWNQAGVPQAVELPFRVGRWLTASGNIVQIGLPGFSGTPASFTYGSQVEALPAVRNVGRADATQIQLDRDQQMAIADRQSAAVVLGGTGWTNAPYPASGVATTTGVAAALSTDVSGQTTGEGDE